MEINNKELKENLVEVVNGIIRNSFGENYRGNYNFSFDSDPDSYISYQDIYRGKRLNLIGARKEKWFSINWLVSARFTKDDGSEIEVYPKYLSEAKEYAKRYKEIFGREVNINLSDNIMSRVKDEYLKRRWDQMCI